MEFITSLAGLEAHYGTPKVSSTVKVADHVTPAYRAWIEASPFCALATAGAGGLDASPRGDRGAVATVTDPHTIVLPDRRGNDRIDSLRNIVEDPRVALMFLIPGSGTIIRVNGTARVTCDGEACARFAVDGQAPRSLVVVRVAEVYFQCSRAVLRSELWSPAAAPEGLPTVGQMLAGLSEGAIDGAAYDADWPERAVKSLW